MVAKGSNRDVTTDMTQQKLFFNVGSNFLQIVNFVRSHKAIKKWFLISNLTNFKRILPPRKIIMSWFFLIFHLNREKLFSHEIKIIVTFLFNRSFHEKLHPLKFFYKNNIVLQYFPPHSFLHIKVPPPLCELKY